MANARQFMAARTAAWAKSGPTAKDYVQNGLIAMWDGIENAGYGVHDSSAKRWDSLVGDLSFALYGGYTWGDQSLVLNGNDSIGIIGYDAIRNSILYNNNCTVEAVASTPSSMSSWGVVYANGSDTRDPLYCIGMAVNPDNGNVIMVASTGGPPLGRYRLIGATDEFKGRKFRSSIKYNGINADPTFVYFNGVSRTLVKSDGYFTANKYPMQFTIGGRVISEERSGFLLGEIMSLRVYSRSLSAYEREENASIDEARFGM